MLLPIPGKYGSRFSLLKTSKSFSKEFTLTSLPNGTKENSKYSIIILMGFSQPPRIFTFFELIRRNNKASLVNMLVTFCSKLECSFLEATMFFLYLHFSTTAKVPRPKTWQIRKFFYYEITKPNFMTNGYERQQVCERFMSLIRFLKLLFIFVSLGLQAASLSHDKNDVTNLLSCDVLLLYFSVSEPIPNLRHHSPLPLPSPYKVLKWKYV